MFTSVEVSLEVGLGLVLGREVSVGVLEPVMLVGTML